MNPLSQNALIPSGMRSLFKYTGLLVLDFEGSTAPTEVVMQISFVKLLEDNGVHKDLYGDIYKVEERMVGRTVEDIVSDLKNTYHLKPSLEELMNQRKQIYADLVEQHDLHVFPFIEPMLKLAKDNGAKIIILSNGTDEVIRDILKKDGVFDYFDHILASDSPERIDLEEKYAKETNGKIKGNKALALAILSCKEWGFSPEEITVVEDNPVTFPKIQTALQEIWVKTFNAGALIGLIGNIRKIYVKHEFNKDKDIPPDTDIIFQGPAPEALCKEWGIIPLSARETTNAPYAHVRKYIF